MRILLSLTFLFFSFAGFANPHWDEKTVPKDNLLQANAFSNWRTIVDPYQRPKNSGKALRITVAWNAQSESYQIAQKIIENSGTESLSLRSKKVSPFGSYRGTVTNEKTNTSFHDSIGTGRAFRKLVRDITFRFPLPESDFVFRMTAEHPVKGHQENVLEEKIKISELTSISTSGLKDVEIYQLRKATASPAIQFVIYAEGFLLENKDHFYQSALRSVEALKTANIPGFAHMNFVGVFASSGVKLGKAQNLGPTVSARDSAFGLYFPYWYDFGRWYHVIYPTDENKFRKSLAVVPYDYNLILVDSADYWGVGNFRSHTAIPTRNYSFTYLLLHELGHYMGLNEEYQGGGPTELEFAPEIAESWSQNLSFLPEKSLDKLKWKALVKDQNTPIPTPNNFWSAGKFGAYLGGYADSVHVHSQAHRPGLACIMESKASFCSVCIHGMQSVIDIDLGQ
jgi:hypothetical protein